jgi:HAD superfamily hydrolase (TIGR01509 family)
MIQAAIFDLDGVIIDSEPVHLAIEERMFKELGVDLSKEEYGSFVGTSPRNMWDVIVKKYGISSTADELVKKQHGCYLDYMADQKDLHPIPGVAELIRKLHDDNFRLVVASSSSMEVINIVLVKFNLSHYFMARVSGADLVQSKPHPEIFITAAKLAHCLPQECVAVEDSKNGITSAKAAGMKCIGFFNPNSGNQNLEAADLIIKSFDELSPEFIRSLETSHGL